MTEGLNQADLRGLFRLGVEESFEPNYYRVQTELELFDPVLLEARAGHQ